MHQRDSRELTGVVAAHRNGFGFVRSDELAESIFLPPPEMRELMHGDRVRVAAVQGADQRWSGRVIEVLQRGVKAFLGKVCVLGRSASVQSADRRLNIDCVIAPKDLAGAKHGDWVIAAVNSYPEQGRQGAASVQQVLDENKPVTMATEAAIAKLGLPAAFSAAAVKDALKHGSQVDATESARRVDLRALPLVTIDGEDARDFDDAVYAERTADGFRLLVAIADVSHYVREGTALDAEAQQRGTSVYFPGRVVPMLPPALSDELCSLKPAVDRLCLTAEMTVSKRGQLKAARFYPAVMKSAARLTYSEVHAALFEGRPEARTKLGGLTEKLLPLVELYRVLLQARQERGALDFDAPEPKFVFDSTEKITAIKMPLRNDAHRLIEECMVLANVAAAQELKTARCPTLFRVHAPPDEKKLDILAATLRALGVELILPPEVAPRDLQQIAPRIKDPAARPFIEQLVVRSMMQAVYQPENLGHFGLALQHYAHFTSPIRRYPDLVVHRTIKAKLDRADVAGRAYELKELEPLGQRLTEAEKRADEADRYVDAFLKCVFLRDRVGEVFEGLITSVVEFGCFVTILEAAADGLLHIDQLRDDDYMLDEASKAWVGRSSKRRLQLGQHVKVQITSVNPVEGLIDLALLTVAGEALPEEAKSREPRATRSATHRPAKQAQSRRPDSKSRSGTHKPKKKHRGKR